MTAELIDTKEKGMPFEAWIAEFERLVVALHPDNEGYGKNQPECWREYYDENWTPEEALDEDRSYWEPAEE